MSIILKADVMAAIHGLDLPKNIQRDLEGLLADQRRDLTSRVESLQHSLTKQEQKIVEELLSSFGKRTIGMLRKPSPTAQAALRVLDQLTSQLRGPLNAAAAAREAAEVIDRATHFAKDSDSMSARVLRLAQLDALVKLGGSRDLFTDAFVATIGAEPVNEMVRGALRRQMIEALDRIRAVNPNIDIELVKQFPPIPHPPISYPASTLAEQADWIADRLPARQ